MYREKMYRGPWTLTSLCRKNLLELPVPFDIKDLTKHKTLVQFVLNLRLFVSFAAEFLTKT
ncbi:hypothetical protein ACRRTK_016997 [Alexandromys fortis]